MTGIAVTRTGGREATERHIPPRLALAVGRPSVEPPAGWKWQALSDIARLESGHTPSRRHPEYWNGSIHWISIRDAKEHHGGVIHDTEEKTTELGIENSSARILPAGTVCLSRTASVGYVVVMGSPMATSQDFVNWVCGSDLDPQFLQHLLIAEGKDLLRFASGAVHQTIYFPEAKAFYACIPDIAEQRRIVAILDEAFEAIATAKANAEKNFRSAHDIFTAALAEFFSPDKDSVSVAELSISVSDGDHAPPPKSASGVPFITITNVDKETREIDFSNTFSVSREYFENLKPQRRPQAGDVLYTVTGSFGIPVLVDGNQEFCFQRHIGLIRPKPSVSSRWLAYALLSPAAKAQADASATGTAQRTVSLTSLRALKLPRSPSDEQARVANQLDALQREVNRLKSISKAKLAALDELKKSLLHRAFSGQL